MNMEKILCMVLLDLCAFACTQAKETQRKEVRKNYEEAFRLAEKLDLPDIQTYEVLMQGIA
ncbi:hypothetical protein ACFLRW_01110 [Acidobacteriota bacterium]